MNGTPGYGAMLLSQPIKGDDELDIALIAQILRSLSSWIEKKQGASTEQSAPDGMFLGQPFRGDMARRDMSDPMATFIAGIGRS